MDAHLTYLIRNAPHQCAFIFTLPSFYSCYSLGLRCPAFSFLLGGLLGDPAPTNLQVNSSPALGTTLGRALSVDPTACLVRRDAPQGKDHASVCWQLAWPGLQQQQGPPHPAQEAKAVKPSHSLTLGTGARTSPRTLGGVNPCGTQWFLQQASDSLSWLSLTLKPLSSKKSAQISLSPESWDSRLQYFSLQTKGVGRRLWDESQADPGSNSGSAALRGQLTLPLCAPLCSSVWNLGVNPTT